MLVNIDERSDKYKVSLDTENENDVRIIAYNSIGVNSTVLDVGCACGDFGVLLSRNKGCMVYGMEYDAGSVAIAMQTNAYRIVHQVDLNTFDEHLYAKYLNYFDSIVLLDVLEHTLEPENILGFFKKFLKKDGFFIISLPNIAFCDIKAALLQDEFTYTSTGILDKTHLRFYTHKSISTMLTESGLEIYECKPKVEYFSTNQLKIPRSIKRYITKDPHSFVYQYLVRVVTTEKDADMLKLINNAQMAIEWSAISNTLNKLKKRRQIATLFPKDTIQYKVAKKLQFLFR